MSILPDAVRAYEQELLQKAEMLALGLNGLKAAAPERAADLLDEIAARLQRAIGEGTPVGASASAPTGALAPSRGAWHRSW